MSEKQSPKAPANYTAAANELDEIVNRLQSNQDIDVDALVTDVARAKFLYTFCNGKITTAEQKINELVEGMKPDDSASGEPEFNGDGNSIQKNDDAEPTNHDSEIPF